MASNVEIFLQAHKQTQESVNKIFEPYFKMKQLEQEIALKKALSESELKKLENLEWLKHQLGKERLIYDHALAAQREQQLESYRAQFNYLKSLADKYPEKAGEIFDLMTRIQAPFAPMAPGTIQDAQTEEPITEAETFPLPEIEEEKPAVRSSAVMDLPQRLEQILSSAERERKQQLEDNIETYQQRIMEAARLYGFPEGEAETLAATLSTVSDPDHLHKLYQNTIKYITESPQSRAYAKEKEQMAAEDVKQLWKSYEEFTNTANQHINSMPVSIEANLEKSLTVSERDLKEALAKRESPKFQTFRRVLLIAGVPLRDENQDIASALGALSLEKVTEISRYMVPFSNADLRAIQETYGATTYAVPLAKALALGAIATKRGYVDGLRELERIMSQTGFTSNKENLRNALSHARDVAKFAYIREVIRNPIMTDTDDDGKVDSVDMFMMSQIVKAFFRENPGFYDAFEKGVKDRTITKKAFEIINKYLNWQPRPTTNRGATSRY